MTGRRMRAASVLGVIAIVSVMITAAASEPENGAIENSINHPVVDEEDRRVEEDERLTKVTVETTWTVRGSKEEAVSEGTIPGQGDNAGNISLAEPQQDQSESLATPVALNDVQRISERDKPENKPQPTTGDYVTSTRAETTFSTDIQGDTATDEPASVKISAGEPDKHKIAEVVASTAVSIDAGTSPVVQKNIEDVRAISFQVPPPAEERLVNQETNKDHSRPLNNLLSSGKSTKGFYEIKPLIKTGTEDDRDPQLSTTTQRTLVPVRKFLVPTVDSAFGKFGPYFEDGEQEINVTSRIGNTMLLDCRIGMLGNKEVAWLQQHSNDSFRLLTIGRATHSVDRRISLNFKYPSNWRLQIQYATPRDSGLYKCQISTHPPLVKNINVIVTAPELTITDDSGRVVPKERHLKAGSALKLRCEARDVLEDLKESVMWTRGDETLTEDVSENRTTEITGSKEVLVIVSTLIVERASPRHAGNYSCVVPEKANTTIAVHVLNGELPAAVHDGNGVSRAFLNLWLIHLTMSYVFSR
ncbi:uncharacterized protein LOC122399900 [Colletes gigas]|uniref:uncharacterized protein LOC122399900 n=1 Tax=Colletes gigas TaxID=935657 RepID=UPI001C9BA21E|nr:uncharacterized protein LOC122399900 [Colletes gigas]